MTREAVRIESAQPGASRWGELAATAAEEVRERVRRSLEMSPADREKLVRRLHDVIGTALEVPAGVETRALQRAELLRAASGDDTVEIAWRRTRQRARRTAAIGAVTTIPAVLPALGAPLAALGLVADWRFAAEQQRDLTLEIAALFGVMPADPTEEVRALFLVSAATAFGSTAAGDAIVKVLGRQIARRSVARLLPGAGAVAAGSLNYVATVALGRVAIRHFADLAGVELRGFVPEQVHAAMPWLRNATLHAFEQPDILAGCRPVYSAEDEEVIGQLAAADREELLDLAVTAATGESRHQTERERILFEIAAALGFDRADVEEARTSTLDEVSSFANRVAGLVGNAGQAGGRAARTLWRRAGRLARKGAHRIGKAR